VPATALILAARAGSVETMKALIEGGAKPDFKAADGATLALAAAAGGRLDALRYALTFSPDLSAQAAGGQTILHVAASTANLPGTGAVLEFLASRGLDLEAKDSRGRTPGDLINQRGTDENKVLFERLVAERKKGALVARAPAP
jgi:ankyrin repeat protein